MVDYSKWNKLSAELSDSDDDLPLPKVTRLDGHERVSIGKQGVSIAPKAAAPATNSSSREAGDESHYINDGASGRFEWRQSKHEVFLRVKVDLQTRSQDVRIIYEPLSRSLSVHCGTAVIVHGTLKYDVQMEDGIVEWELITLLSERYISLVLRKKCPLERAVIWWSSVFTADEQIDVTAIAERTLIAQDFKETWDEAHRKFREKVKASNRTEINIPGPHEDDALENSKVDYIDELEN